MGMKRRGSKRKRSGHQPETRRKHRAPGRPVPASLIKRLQEWPIYEALVTEDWQEPGTVAQLILSRQSPETGDYAAGVFLVDLGCLGVKNGYLSLLDSEEYDMVVDYVRSTQPLIACDPDLVAKILLTALEYADSLGFEPHPDAVDAFPILLGTDASACDEPVPVGDGKGKPFYISGPYDNVDRIMATLDRAVGWGGYEFIAGVPEEDLPEHMSSLDLHELDDTELVDTDDPEDTQ